MASGSTGGFFSTVLRETAHVELLRVQNFENERDARDFAIPSVVSDPKTFVEMYRILESRPRATFCEQYFAVT